MFNGIIKQGNTNQELSKINQNLVSLTIPGVRKDVD